MRRNNYNPTDADRAKGLAAKRASQNGRAPVVYLNDAPARARRALAAEIEMAKQERAFAPPFKVGDIDR